MLIIPWSDDLKTGFEVIDGHHKHLFDMANSFAAKAENENSNEDAINFINSLWDYAEMHFGEEERRMAEVNYPLLDYHAAIHQNLRNTLTQVQGFIAKDEVLDPHSAVGSIACEWLNNHIGMDDLAFADFCNNRGMVITKEFENIICEISTVYSRLLSKAETSRVDAHQITLKHERIQGMSVNDIVKLTFNRPPRGAELFVGRISALNEKEIKLCSVKPILQIYERQFYRLPAAIDAKMFYMQEEKDVKVMDIGIGGVQVETPMMLRRGEKFTLHMNLLNKPLSFDCIVASHVTQSWTKFYYGCTFVSAEKRVLDLITEYVFRRWEKIGTE